MQDLSIDIKTMPQAFGGYHLLLVITCNQTNFTIVVPLRDRQTQTIAEALIYRVIYLFSPPRWIVCDEAAEFTSAIIQAILTMLNCRLKVISPYNHGSSKCERQIKMISDIIVKHLWDKGQMWPLFATTAAYAMNTFASEALSGFSPFQLVFLRDPPDLTSLSFLKIDTIPVNYRCTIPVPVIVLCLFAIFVRNINSSELHFQSVALRSQYSDHVPEAVTLH